MRHKNWFILLSLFFLVIILLTGGFSIPLIKLMAWLSHQTQVDWRIVSPLELMLISIWGVSALLLGMSRTIWQAIEGDKPLRLWVVGGCFLAFAAIVWAPPTNQFNTLVEILRLISIWGFATMLIVSFRYYPWSEKSFFRFYSNLALAIAILGLWQFWSDEGSRMTADWINPSLLAAFITPAWLLALCRNGEERLSAWNITRIAIIGTAILLTYSRGIIAALLISIPIGYFLIKRTKRNTTSVFVVVTIIILILGNIGLGMGRWQGVGDGQAYGRTQIWGVAGNIIVNAPWRGVGGGCFADVTYRYKFPATASPFLWSKVVGAAHNEYLQVAAEWGLPVLGLLIYLLVLMAVRYTRSLPGLPGTGWAFLVFMLHSGIDNLWHFFPTVLLGAALFASVIHRVWHVLPAVNPVPRARWLNIAVVGMLLVITLPIAIGEYYFLAGRAEENMGRLISSGELYEKAVQFSPLSGIYRMHLGGIFLQMGKGFRTTRSEQYPLAINAIHNAVTQFQLAVQLEPANPIYHSQLARTYLIRDDYWHAVTSLRHALTYAPTDVRLLRKFATIIGKKNGLAAGYYLRRAVLLEPLYASAYADLADAGAPRDFWRRMAIATHEYSYNYLGYLSPHADVRTSIFNYVASLQDSPPERYTDNPLIDNEVMKNQPIRLW